MGAGGSVTKSAIEELNKASEADLKASMADLTPEERAKLTAALEGAGKAEAKPEEKKGGIAPGTTGIVLAMKVPDGEDVEFVDKFFKDHMPWMGKTHKGPEAPMSLAYVITKMPEPTDPDDPSKGTTGKTLYSLIECYPDGKHAEAHMAEAGKDKEAGGDILDRFQTCAGKYGVSSHMMAPVVQTMSDPLLSSISSIKPGCKSLSVCLKVPNADVEAVDTFFADHKAFMDKTHPTSGDTEPVILLYMVTKMAGEEGFTLYSQTEIFKGKAGLDKHFEVGMADPIGPRFMENLKKYSVYASIGADVAYTFE